MKQGRRGQEHQDPSITQQFAKSRVTVRALARAGGEYIGYGVGAAGSFTQSGGTNTVSAGTSIYLGAFSGAAGAYTLAGGKALVSGGVYVGKGSRPRAASWGLCSSHLPDGVGKLPVANGA